VRVSVDDLMKSLVKDEATRNSMLSEGGLRLWPQIHGTDGFFAAVWERR